MAACPRGAEQERRVARESIDEIVAAGLGRILQPRRFGGYEISHDAAFDVAVTISAACGSTGWCASLLNMHDWWLAAFPEEAQHDVWRDTPDVNLAGAISPLSGKAAPVEGGNRSGPQERGASFINTLVRGKILDASEPA